MAYKQYKSLAHELMVPILTDQFRKIYTEVTEDLTKEEVIEMIARMEAERLSLIEPEPKPLNIPEDDLSNFKIDLYLAAKDAFKFRPRESEES